jgi:hypothetical protein
MGSGVTGNLEEYTSMSVLETYYVTCEVNGDREVTRWQAKDAAHALEQFLDDPALSEGATAIAVAKKHMTPTWNPPNVWDQHSDHPRADWVRDVREGNTQRGYVDWVNAQLDEQE